MSTAQGDPGLDAAIAEERAKMYLAEESVDDQDDDDDGPDMGDDDDGLDMGDEAALDLLEEVREMLDRADDDAGLSNAELRKLAKDVRRASRSL